MKKTISNLFIAMAILVISAMAIHAMDNAPIKTADCSAKNTVKKTDGTCECKRSRVWDASKSQCVLATTWCSKNFVKRSAYNAPKNQCECRKGQELNASGTTCVKAVQATEVTLDDSDMEHGSAQYDFETGQKTVYGSPDLFIGGIVFNGNWMPSLDWQVVEMEKPFKEVAECPAKGYASVKNVDPATGFGSPIYAMGGKTYCLKTSEGNFAKLEILSAEYDSQKDLRILKFKTIFNKNGSRKFE